MKALVAIILALILPIEVHAQEDALSLPKLIGFWIVKDGELNLEVVNNGTKTVLLDDPIALPRFQPVERKSNEELRFEHLTHAVEFAPGEEERLDKLDMLTNRAYWLAPVTFNSIWRDCSWRIKLSKKGEQFLQQHKTGVFRVSAVEGVMTRDEDMVETAKTMLLTRFTTDIVFRHASNKKKRQNKAQK